MRLWRYLGLRLETGRWPARLLLTLGFICVLPPLAWGQTGGRGEVLDELRGRLDAIERTFARVAGTLGENPTSGRATVAELETVVVVGLQSHHAETGAAGGKGWPDDRMREVFARGDALRDRILAIYAGSRSDGAREVEAAVDEYLVASGTAVAAAPKSMDWLNSPRGPRFDALYPDIARLMWSAGWVQLAAVEPLLVFREEADRAAGLNAVMMRYAEMLEVVDRSPTHMPMAPAIAPEFVTRHPRAAAIFDNLNLLRGRYLDLLVDAGDENARTAVNDLIADFANSDHMTISEMEWIVMALRHGIYAQGGPAIGRLERSERNDGGHHGVHGGGIQMPMPGM